MGLSRRLYRRGREKIVEKENAMGNIYCDRERERETAMQRAREEILSSAEVEKMASAFRMLSDPTRLKLVLALLKGNMCVYHLAEVANGTVSGVSHQLRVLRDANIVKVERLGRNMEYSIADEHVRKMIELGMEHLTCTNKE